MATAELKKCTKCGDEKPKTKEFFAFNRGGLTYCKKCTSKYQTERAQRLRTLALVHYSQDIPHCACCGEEEYQFLSIDHIEGGGTQHRKKEARNTYHWLFKNNYPEGYQVLCHNCNMAKGLYGICPHQKKKSET